MSETIVLTGATVLTGRDLEPRAGSVTVEGARIREVSPPGDAPPGGRALDAAGLTLLPGFIDAHVHIAFHPPGDVLRGGVTTVRDLAWQPNVILPLAERSRAREFDGPEIFSVGPMVTAPGGYPLDAAWAPEGTGFPISTPADGEEIVARLAHLRVAAIKVALNPPAGPTLDGATLAAIVDAAHERGLKVTGHVHGLEQLDKALDAGVDELAHMLMGDERIPDRTIERMVTSGMAVVPTLAIRVRKERKVAIENLARFRDAGGVVVYGTDLGNEGTTPGIDPREIAGMAKAGLDGAAIVRSATVEAARWLGMDDRGALVPGLRADIIGIRGNPLSNPRALVDVGLVVRCGRVIKEP